MELSSSADIHLAGVSDPFNHYNTEIVKLDANQWTEEGGQLVRRACNQEAMSSESQEAARDGHELATASQFGLLTNDEVDERLRQLTDSPQADSVNVTIEIVFPCLT